MSSVTNCAVAARPFDAARTTRYQSITIAADVDADGRLILVGERLSGVLVRLDALHEANHGRWFLEAGFGKLADATGTIFDTLESAMEQIGRLIEAD